MDALLEWFTAFADWLAGLGRFIFSIPFLIRDLMAFFLWWLSKFVDYIFYTLLMPIYDYIEHIDLPCTVCVSGLIQACDYLVNSNWSSSFGFNAFQLLSYTLSFFNVEYAIEVIFTATLAKFVLRRIPGIG